jgi:hypothetical protein
MPPVNVDEMEHWKERIARLIDRRIEAVAAGDPGLLDRIRGQARRRAWQSLGLAEIQAELDALAAQKEDLEQRERRAYRALLATVRRLPVEEVPDAPGGGPPPEVAQALRQRQAAHEEELLGADERGREVLRLRRETEGLLDAVWLAASSRPMKDLWKRAVALLGEAPTALQKEALAIGSAEGE